MSGLAVTTCRGHWAPKACWGLRTSCSATAWINSGARNMAGKGKKKKAEIVFLVCEETGDHNYTLRRKPGGEKLKLKKYCPRLRKHTVHAEKKK